MHDSKQLIQDEDYAFPYHYVPQFSPGYTQTYSWTWGLYYVSAMEYVLAQVKQLKPMSVADIGTGDGRLVRPPGRAEHEGRHLERRGVPRPARVSDGG